jgi:pyruvate/2-oxoglutarate/acetoin dehydrogenase E1 component
MSDVAFWEARGRALAACLDADPTVVIVGHATSWPFNPDDGIPSTYADRFLHPPISEFATLGAALGAATAGVRPYVSAGTSTFTYYAWSVLVNEAPHIRYVTGGQVTAPLVVHMQAGARRAGGVQHEHTPQAMLQNVAGLVVYAPATPQAIYDVVRASLGGDDPVVIIDHVLLGDAQGPLEETAAASALPLEVLREGSDGLIVGTSLMSQRALAAADRIAAEGGGSLAVVNVTRLSPLPIEQLARLVEDQPFTLFVDESRLAGSPAASMLTGVQRIAAHTGELHVLTAEDAPFPFAPSLLDAIVPTTARIEETVRQIMNRALG